jgi:hemerythrin-like domain-containing protein
MTMTPDLTIWYLTHRGMRSDIRRLHATVASLERPERGRARELERWFRGFLTEFHHHHAVEDEIFLPALAERVSGFARSVERVDAEHHELDGALRGVGAALRDLTDLDERWHRSQPRASVALAEAERVLNDHLDFEDADVLPLFLRHMAKEDFDVCNEQAIKRVGITSLLFVVPWVVSHATDEERDSLWDDVPAQMKLLWHATHRRYERRVRRAFADTPVTVAAAPVIGEVA